MAECGQIMNDMVGRNTGLLIMNMQFMHSMSSILVLYPNIVLSCSRSVCDSLLLGTATCHFDPLE